MPTVKANGIDIYYEIHGEGPPLTLIMGLGCSIRQWQWILPELAKSFQVIAFDNRGAGKSSKPDMEYTTDLHADDIAALLDVLEIPQTHLFGASVGGMIAQAFALRHPDRLDRLVLGCTMPDFLTFQPAPDDLEALQGSSLLPFDESVEAVWNLFLTDEYVAHNPEKAEALKVSMAEDKAERGEDAFMLQLGAAMEHNTFEQVKNIKAKTLVIAGNQDQMAPAPNYLYLAEQIPNATLEVLDGAGHAFWVDSDMEAVRLITAFLKAP